MQFTLEKQKVSNKVRAKAAQADTQKSETSKIEMFTTEYLRNDWKVFRQKGLYLQVVAISIFQAFF